MHYQAALLSLVISQSPHHLGMDRPRLIITITVNRRHLTVSSTFQVIHLNIIKVGMILFSIKKRPSPMARKTNPMISAVQANQINDIPLSLFSARWYRRGKRKSIGALLLLIRTRATSSPATGSWPTFPCHRSHPFFHGQKWRMLKRKRWPLFGVEPLQHPSTTDKAIRKGIRRI